MTTDDDTYDLATGADAGGTGNVAMPDTGGMDTTMADGRPSGAAGVANAELGTSGPPAEKLLTPEELAATEITGGAGLEPDALTEERLAGFLGETQE